MSILTQVIAGCCWILYGSFFEWFWHKYWMHTPRIPKEAFRGHTIVHHGLYKGDESYFVPEDEDPEHILLKPYALPLIFLGHLPVILLINRFLVPNTAIGGLTAVVLYFVVYEYMHWNMHVPRGHFVEKFRWFQFLREHHKLHHRIMQKNFCVLFPLADVVFGTLITEESLRKRREEREQAIDSGVAAPQRRWGSAGRSGGRVKLSRLASMRLARISRMSPIARKLTRFGSRRSRDSRKETVRKERKAMVMIELSKHRRGR